MNIKYKLRDCVKKRDVIVDQEDDGIFAVVVAGKIGISDSSFAAVMLTPDEARRLAEGIIAATEPVE